MVQQDENELMIDVKNIKTHETYALPSKGLVYKPEENIPASITLRRMTTKEDKIRMRNLSEDKIRRDLLQACITTEGVDAGKLKLVDANLLLFRLRSLSLLNDKYKVTCVCPTCGTEFIHEVNLSEVPVEYLSDDILDKMSIKLPISQNTIQLKYPSINDTIKMSDNLIDYFNQFPNADRSETLYTLGALLYIDTVDNRKLLSEEKEVYLDNLDIIDSRVLQNAISHLDNLYGFTETLKTRCPKCNREVEHGLPITRELFNPSN